MDETEIKNKVLITFSWDEGRNFVHKNKMLAVLDEAISQTKKELIEEIKQDLEYAYKYLYLHSVEELVSIFIVKRDLNKINDKLSQLEAKK